MLYDIIVVGGGLAGSVVSNRLLGFNESLKILVVEAGQNANNRTDIIWPNQTAFGGDLSWGWDTIPQVNLDNRTMGEAVGTALGGGTVVNAGNWVRGDRTDYDLWGETVGDSRWNYDGQLPFMQKAEAFQHPDRNPDQHGYDGPVFVQTVTSTNRSFPLREPVFQAWNEIGVFELPDLDANAGNPLGVGDFSENKHNGRREIASVIYPLNGIDVLTETLVEKVLVQDVDGVLTSLGIQLSNGTQILGSKVILSAGAFRTPQILLLSGIGPASELESLEIDVNLDLPDVGRNLIQHSSTTSTWTIRNPDEGWIPGSGNPLFEEEQYGWGNPQDYMVSTSVPRDGLAVAIEIDEGVAPDPETHPLLRTDRTFLEHVFQYFGYTGTSGATVSFMSILFIPSARGSVTLASANISDFPLLDPNYFGTEVDRYVLREASRLQYAFAGGNTTVLGRDIFAGEIPPDGSPALSSVITDEELDTRLRATLRTAYHPHGTAAMGKVVDTNLKVIGVDNLYVVDTSVFPVAISAHLQVATYALAEQAAEILAGST
ncbi:hypothetical protein PFICI_09688 [Pestalotiopsis fici W106-1]|uniref:Glucose-methanol-choline oxidoreductase N-terminal domain-containing protein n=1 Tax=Pestalotiopsis fici (strain W106-1 / CGMCC3.15140) TaxID=1229662 RepID=W3WXL3_PESFW|nr:uncharacterized protein PFICI_09688 [Pestalotiopsis fici W106-1]ETS77626.1 hypothetical protein PFICI_09688 [Pestalotiopsis fici W106-1]